MKDVYEIHEKCPLEKNCTSTLGYCHCWKTVNSAQVSGKLVTTKLIYDCDKPLLKV